MAKRILAVVEPTLLRWARDTAGYTIEEVAKRLKKDARVILAWEEAGDERPTMGQLRRLAGIYKRPLSDFYLPKPPEERPFPHDFRRAPGEVALVYSPALRRQLRLARERRDLALSLYEELQEPIAPIGESISLSAAPEAVGARIRELLRVSFEQQKRWGDGRSAYNAWRRRIEVMGGLVFQFERISPEEAWGFSIVEAILPVIGINRGLAPNGRTFTMLHELTHVLLGESATCDIDDLAPRGAPEMRVEAFCNRAAAAALMPERIFLDHRVIREHTHGREEWGDLEIEAIARTFGASREAAVRRLETFGLTSLNFYHRKRLQYNDEFEQKRRAERAVAKDKPIRRNMPQEAISNLGHRYVSLILQNYQEDRITLLDASDYLGVRAEKVRSVENLATDWVSDGRRDPLQY